MSQYDKIGQDGGDGACRRCLFLDISGHGIVGIDFRLGSNQAEWVKRGLTHATTAVQSTVAFMNGWVGMRRPV